MSPADVTTAEATIVLPVSTLIRILAVLDDAEQAYGDLREAGLAEPEDVTAAAATSAMYAELDTLRVGPATRMALLSELCDECTADGPCHAHPWPGLAALRPAAGQGTP